MTRSPLVLRHLLAALLCVTCTEAASALECPDYISEDWDDKPTCAWLRNDTDKTLYFDPFVFYASSGDLNDDYWIGPSLVLLPGELKVVAAFDSDGWGAFNWDTAMGASAIYIDGVLAGYLHMKIDLGAGVVHDFEYSLGTRWVDGFDLLFLDVGGTYYSYVVQDKWNYDRAVFDVFFTISSQTTLQGNMGYLPPDTSDDPGHLNVMSYNTYLLLGPSSAFGKQDYCERADRIATYGPRIFANVDILVLQELASQDTCTPDAEQLATGEFLCCGPDKPFRDRTSLLNGEPLVNGDLGPSETGGVVIMSRYPDSLHGSHVAQVDYEDSPWSLGHDDEVHYIFRSSVGECSGIDCTMDKGFLRVKFTKPAQGPDGPVSQDYYIIGTHLQADAGAADRNARSAQFNAIRGHIAALPSDVPILIAGDLNTEHDEIDPMHWALNAHSGTWQGPLYASENYQVNYYAHLQHDSIDYSFARYDWVLASNHGPAPASFDWRYLTIRDLTWGRADLSDHEAVLAEIQVPEPSPAWMQLGMLASLALLRWRRVRSRHSALRSPGALVSGTGEGAKGVRE